MMLKQKKSFKPSNPRALPFTQAFSSAFRLSLFELKTMQISLLTFAGQKFEATFDCFGNLAQ